MNKLRLKLLFLVLLINCGPGAHGQQGDSSCYLKYPIGIGPTANQADLERIRQTPLPDSLSGIKGLVLIRVLIDENGNHVSDRVVVSPSPEIGEWYRIQVSEIRWEPAIGLNGSPVPVWMNIPFKPGPEP